MQKLTISRFWMKVSTTTSSRMETFLISIFVIAGEPKHNDALSSSFSNQYMTYDVYVILIASLDRFLLDFKREFSYPRVYRVWETIWAAGKRHFFSISSGVLYSIHLSGQISSPQFYLFIALSLVETYRDIIIDR